MTDRKFSLGAPAQTSGSNDNGRPSTSGINNQQSQNMSDSDEEFRLGFQFYSGIHPSWYDSDIEFGTGGPDSDEEKKEVVRTGNIFKSGKPKATCSKTKNNRKKIQAKKRGSTKEKDLPKKEQRPTTTSTSGTDNNKNRKRKYHVCNICMDKRSETYYHRCFHSITCMECKNSKAFKDALGLVQCNICGENHFRMLHDLLV